MGYRCFLLILRHASFLPQKYEEEVKDDYKYIFNDDNPLLKLEI